MKRPDFSSREPTELARIFEDFGEIECPQLDAELYRKMTSPEPGQALE